MIARLDRGPLSLQACVEYHNRAKDGDSEARNRLVEFCLPIAATVVDWFGNTEDIQVEANLETIKAVDLWDRQGELTSFVTKRVAERIKTYLGLGSPQQCPSCKTSFVPRQKIQRFCTEACRVKASRARAVARKQAQRVHKCNKCGVDLEPTSVVGIRKRYSKYCPACKKETDLRRQRRWKKQNRVDRKEQGVCSRCDQPVVPGQSSCQAHLDKSTDWWRKRNGWKPLYDLTCEICKQPFQSERKYTKFCSGCKEEAAREKDRRWREKNRPPTQHSLNCEECGGEFTAKRSDRMYCDDCRKKKPWRKKSKLEPPKPEPKPEPPKLEPPKPEPPKSTSRYHCYPLGEFRFYTVQVQVDFDDFESTNANPGSEEKILVLQDRVARGLPLFHPEDRTHKMPMFHGFETWLLDDHPEPTVNSHMNPKEHEYA